MAPKKGKKISLNEFLVDSALGSWADEMDSLPNAPAPRTDDENARGSDRYGKRDDFLSSRPDRGPVIPREDVPLPTQPPFTAFIGNLSFELTEAELGEYFTGLKTRSIKIIRDRDEKPKGFGYIEFEDLEGLKDALTKTGSSLSGRTIRVSVAEPPKERSGFSGGGDDDSKFDSPWRRDGPLPDISGTRESRRRYDGPSNDRTPLPSLSEGANDWRANRPPPRTSLPDTETRPTRRQGSGFSTPDGLSGAADKEEVWTIGSKFKPAANDETSAQKFQSVRAKGEFGLPKDQDDGDWRRGKATTRGNISPTTSTPPTPQLARRKLELLPRTGPVSATPSPLSSPKMGPTPSSSNNPRSNPFGNARPVDVTPREKEVQERLEKEREASKEKLVMSRTSSRTASERPQSGGVLPPQRPASPAKPSATIRPTLSFARAAAKRDTEKPGETEDASTTEQSESAV